MTTDNIATLTGSLAFIGAGVAALVPPEYGVGITKISMGIAMIAGIIFAYYTNKTDAPAPPPDPSAIKALADQLQAMVEQLNAPKK